MNAVKPTFFVRLSLALRMLGDGGLAAAALRATRGDAHALPQAEPALRVPGPEAALQLLAMLQREGRFVDFLQEDVAGYSDAEVGAAARVVHEGCRKALAEHFSIEPVRAEAEGSRVVLERGFDASEVRLAGNVVGEPPFTGTLTHRGWRVSEAKLPKLAAGHDARVLAPAEVEL